jgi:predicted AAA+ superfamily ATPase
MAIQRKLYLPIKQSLKSGKSVLLLGPRQTGKSTLSRDLKPDLEFNLANESVFLEFAKDPNFLASQIRLKAKNRGLVFVDEIQRQPKLMNTAQDLIDSNKELKFILTGSSARKLRRGQANLLPGRIHSYELNPLISFEVDYAMDTEDVLAMGTLPGIFVDEDTRNIKRTLKSYAITYLQEEIKSEALTKNLDGFTRFLFNIAADSTKFVDLSKISKNIGVPRQTVQRFFEILEDTLLIHRCLSFAKSDKRRLIQHPRFFFFDNGVLNSLLGSYNGSADRRGFLFENLFFNQLRSSLESSDLDYRLSSYRTEGGAEVDIVLEIGNNIYALEVKSGAFSKKDLAGLKSLQDFVGKKVIPYVIVPDGYHRAINDIEVIPWQSFLKNLHI